MMNQDTIDAIAEAIWDATNDGDGFVGPQRLTDQLAKHGYLIIRDPAHAPEAVEAAAEKLCCRDGCPASRQECQAKNVYFEEDARAALTAYIERAR